MTTTNEGDDIARAEREVDVQRARLSASLRRVGKTSQDLAHRVTSELKPFVVLAIGVAGAAAAIGVTVALLRKGRRRNVWRPREQPSALGKAAQVAGMWALRIVARRLAQEVVARLGAAAPASPVVPATSIPSGTSTR